MGLTRFASVHPTRDSEATETNDLNEIELLNTTACRTKPQEFRLSDTAELFDLTKGERRLIIIDN